MKETASLDCRFPLNTGNLGLVVLGRFLIASFPMGREAPKDTSHKGCVQLESRRRQRQTVAVARASEQVECTLQAQRSKLQLWAKLQSHGGS